jgi:hypothetical protein
VNCALFDVATWLVGVAQHLKPPLNVPAQGHASGAGSLAARAGLLRFGARGPHPGAWTGIRLQLSGFLKSFHRRVPADGCGAH